MIPNLFRRVEIWCVAGKPFESEPFRVKRLEVFGRGAMHRVSIPYQNDLVSKMTVHLREEPDHVVGLNILPRKVKVQLQRVEFRRNRDGSNRRQPIVAIPGILQRCLSARCPCTSTHRLHHESALIDKYDASLL